MRQGDVVFNAILPKAWRHGTGSMTQGGWVLQDVHLKSSSPPNPRGLSVVLFTFLLKC